MTTRDYLATPHCGVLFIHFVTSDSGFSLNNMNKYIVIRKNELAFIVVHQSTFYI